MSDQTDKLLQEANECEMLGGLAAAHDERVAYRERAERLRILASEAHRLSGSGRQIGRAPVGATERGFFARVNDAGKRHR